MKKRKKTGRSVPKVWRDRMRLIESTRGRWFYAEFVKRDGTLRRMICRYGVRKGTRRITPPKNDPYVTGMAIVWDAFAQDFRIITLATMISLRCGDIMWHGVRAPVTTRWLGPKRIQLRKKLKTAFGAVDRKGT